MLINLNVSGKTFKVQKDVLCKSQLFSNMFADCDVIDDEIMILRSAKLFERVYAYLLDDKYPYPRKYSSELDYYLISYDICSLYDPNEEWRTNESLRINNEISKIKGILTVAIDRVFELSIDPERPKCRYFECDGTCDYRMLACAQHKWRCCHYSDEDEYGDHIFCNNETDGSIIYCDEHLIEHMYDRW